MYDKFKDYPLMKDRTGNVPLFYPHIPKNSIKLTLFELLNLIILLDNLEFCLLYLDQLYFSMIF